MSKELRGKPEEDIASEAEKGAGQSRDGGDSAEPDHGTHERMGEEAKQGPLESDLRGAKGDYEIGYGRPPLHTRFPPGVSGNPKGRPKGSLNGRMRVKRVLDQKVKIRRGSRTSTVTMLEAVMESQAIKGMKDPRSANIVISIADKVGLFNEEDKTGAGGDKSETPAEIKRPSEWLFQSIDLDLLSVGEKIELSRFGKVIDRGGDVTALSTGEFERLKQILAKGRRQDLPRAA